MTERIRVLFLAANPDRPNSRSRLDEELRQIDKKIEAGKDRDRFQLISTLAVKADDLQHALLRHQPHIVHFSGYASKSRGIALEGEDGKPCFVAKQALADLFKILSDNIRLVLLNACYAGDQAQGITDSIDFAIGIDGSIDSAASIIFASHFYQALAFGRSIQESFDLAVVAFGLRGINGANQVRLMSRKGVDPAQTYLFPKSDDLGRVLSRLVGGTASLAELESVRNALMEGRLILHATDQPDSAGVGASVRTSSHGGHFHATIAAPVYKRLQELLYPGPSGVAPPPPSLIFVGREEAVRDIRHRLRVERDRQPAASLTVIRGWPGVGKSTLVGAIGRDPDLPRSFPDGVLWAALDQTPELLSILASWGRALGDDGLIRVPTLKEATVRISALLKNKRFLLIADDVWEPAHLTPFLNARGEGCHLLVTTRLTELAECLAEDQRGSIYVLPVLTEANAVKLLQVLAPAAVEQHPEECRELVRDLECLPLALRVAGSLLRTEAKLGWGVADLLKDIRKGARIIDEKAPTNMSNGETRPSVSALLRNSTDRLDDVTRECFAFLGAFAPKPATFDLAAMKAVWQVKDPRQIVRTLVGHGLLEPAGDGRFKMHALLVAHAESLCS